MFPGLNHDAAVYGSRMHLGVASAKLEHPATVIVPRLLRGITHIIFADD